MYSEVLEVSPHLSECQVLPLLQRVIMSETKDQFLICFLILKAEPYYTLPVFDLLGPLEPFYLCLFIPRSPSVFYPYLI